MKYKRRWNWTQKNLRKTRSVSYRGDMSPPNSFLKWYTRSDRMRTKRGVIDELNGLIADFPLRSHRHTAYWDYW